jgi:general secretion pathway protein A
MYTQHFHLSEPPFSIVPNPRFLYLSAQHREALAHLLYGIGVGGGFVVLTGEVGTGKTTLCRCLLDQLPEDVDLALIFNPRLNSRELLAGICDELRIAHPGKASLKQLIDLLNHHLLEAHARGRRTIVLIDEAQNLRFDVLEQIRLLTNLETNQAKLLQIILVGQPELNRVLERPNLRQLAQRITARYHLRPLSRRETGDYLRHRLAVAGNRDRLFTRAAIRAIHARAGGIPRLVNLIADRALLGAYTLGRDRVNGFVARKAARELAPARTRPWLPRLAAGLAGALVLAGGALFFGGPPEFFGPGREQLSVPASTLFAKAATAPGAGPELPRGRIPEAAPAPAEKPPAAGPEPAVPFAAWIAGPAASRPAAFARLFSLWRLDAPGEGSEACALAGRRGLHCLPLHGTWFQLRSFNHPAVLEFMLPDGARRYAALVKLRDGKAELSAGEGTPKTFELAEILPFWKGDAVLLWKPPRGEAWPQVQGARSDTVAWLRERLRVPAPPGQESLFDAELKARISAFQTERGLVPDGVAGPQTMIYLGMRDGDSAVPRLEAVSP